MALVTVVPRASRTRARAWGAVAVVVTVVVAVFGLHAGSHAPLPRVAPNESIAFDISLRSSGDAPAVEQWLRAGGLSATTIDPAGELVHVSGPAHAVDVRLGVVLVRYTVDAFAFHRPVHNPVLPAAIAARVRAVVGLDNASDELVRPNVGGRLAVACASRNACLTRAGIAKAMDLDPLYDENILGAGQTVAVVMDGNVDPNDLAQFDREEGIRGPIDFSEIDVDPLQSSETQGNAGVEASSEATLDIETIHMIAPAARIMYYKTTFEGTGIADAYERILKDGKATIVNYSAGACETGPPDAGSPQAAVADAIAAFKHAHVTLFASSGDHGVYSCLAGDFAGTDADAGDWVAAGSFPADSPDAVAVGGTYLQHGPDDSYISEAAWISPLTNWATGGGVSPNDPAPPWQNGIPLVMGNTANHRQYPDVAAPGADEESGWTIVFRGEDIQSSGTSASAPFWAGYAALVRQAAAQAHTGTFPFFAPVLYAVAATNANVFHDIQRGTNLRDTAGPGWDDATGLGSPVGADLANAIVAYLKAHPNAAAND
jgi:kumamolisin